jgi:secondary thiamine-phosphate synthase enzyme
MIKQKEIIFKPLSQGFHKIENHIYKALGELPETGVLNLFVKHTSAAVMITENADPAVQVDLKTLFDKLAPENASFYVHTIEGSDDMPAHFKSVVIGVSLNIPISNHKLNLGTWQGIYLCEFRKYGGQRKVVATVFY